MLDGEFAIALLDFRRRRAVISTAPWLRGPLWMWYFEPSKSTIFEGQHDLKSSVKRGKVHADLETFGSHRLNSVLEKCEKSSKAEDIFSTKPLWFSTYGGAGLWVRMAVLRVSLQMRIDGGPSKDRSAGASCLTQVSMWPVIGVHWFAWVYQQERNSHTACLAAFATAPLDNLPPACFMCNL